MRKQGRSDIRKGDLLDESRLTRSRAVRWADVYEPPPERKRGCDANLDAAEAL